jgi:MFS transporter, FHS family, L-fucose permease
VNQPSHFNVASGPYLLLVGFALFMIGRMSGSFMMKSIKPSKLLAFYACMCCVLLPVVCLNLGWNSILALYGIFFFMSIMFPTIFALAINDLGSKTKKASSFLIMYIVSGALFPPIMGYIADATNSMSIGFLSPIPFFIYIFYYAINGFRVIKN